MIDIDSKPSRLPPAFVRDCVLYGLLGVFSIGLNVWAAHGSMVNGSDLGLAISCVFTTFAFFSIWRFVGSMRCVLESWREYREAWFEHQAALERESRNGK
jgi:hypothetical protein